MGKSDLDRFSIAADAPINDMLQWAKAARKLFGEL